MNTHPTTEAKVAAARAKAEVTKAQLEKVKKERAGIKLSTDAAKAVRCMLHEYVCAFVFLSVGRRFTRFIHPSTPRTPRKPRSCRRRWTR